MNETITLHPSIPLQTGFIRHSIFLLMYSESDTIVPLLLAFEYEIDAIREKDRLIKHENLIESNFSITELEVI